MRSMTPSLAAATRRAMREPRIEIRIADLPRERPRFEWTGLYSGLEGDQPSAAAVAADGSILRLRTAPTGGTVYFQRVADPADPSQWSNWGDAGIQSWGGGSAGDARLDLAVDPIGGGCWRYVGKLGGGVDQGQVWYSRSLDNGVTWSAWTLAEDLGSYGYVRGIAAWHSQPHDYLAVAYEPGSVGNQDCGVILERFDGDVWNEVARIDGRWPLDGVDLDGDETGHVYLMAAESNPWRIWHREWDGSAWADEIAVLQVGDGASLSYANPRFGKVASYERHCLIHVERSSSPTAPRALIGFTPRRWCLTEEVPWRYETTHGVEVIRSADWWYVIGGDRAYRSPVFGGVDEALEIPDEDVLAIDSEVKADRPGKLRVLLDNTSGRYDATGCVRPGAQLALKLGLKTTEGTEGIWQTPWWITRVGVEERADRGERYLVVEARDCWGELEALRATRQHQWENRALAEVIQSASWRVCGRDDGGAHANLAQIVPGFAVKAGDDWSEVARRLTRMSGVLLRWRTDEESPLGNQSVVPEAIDFGGGEAVWAFGRKEREDTPTPAQLWSEIALWRGEGSFQSVQVFGESCWGEHRDWDVVWESWRDTSLRVIDRLVDSEAKVADRADWEWRRVAADRAGGRLRVGAVAGLEVGDVVTIEVAGDGSGSSSEANLVVLGIRTILERRASRRGGGMKFEQVVDVGGIA